MGRVRGVDLCLAGTSRGSGWEHLEGMEGCLRHILGLGMCRAMRYWSKIGLNELVEGGVRVHSR